MFHASSVTLGIVYLTFNAIAISFIGTALYTMIIKYSDQELSGSVTGFVSFGGQIAGGISPLVIGFILTIFNGSYTAVCWFLIVSALAGAVAALAITNKVKKQKRYAYRAFFLKKERCLCKMEPQRLNKLFRQIRRISSRKIIGLLQRSICRAIVIQVN